MAYLHALTHTPEVNDYWAGQSKFSDTFETTQDAATLGCNKVTVAYTRTTPVGTVEDRCVYSFALAKIVGGGLYSVLTLAELTTLETPLQIMITAIAAVQPSSYKAVELIWHEHRASHGPTEAGQETVPPAVKRTTIAITGSAGVDRTADQIASTCTLRTCSRKHWGRFYIPGIRAGRIDPATGRITSLGVNDLLTAVHDFQASAASASAQLGVWSWRHKAFMPISELRMDDVPDIQRRRRAKQVSYFKSYTS